MGICGQYRTRQKIFRPIRVCTIMVSFIETPHAIIILERSIRSQICYIIVVQGLTGSFFAGQLNQRNMACLYEGFDGLQIVQRSKKHRVNVLNQENKRPYATIAKLRASLCGALVENEELSRTIDLLLKSYDKLERKYLKVKKENANLQNIANVMASLHQDQYVSSQNRPMHEKIVSDDVAPRQNLTVRIQSPIIECTNQSRISSNMCEEKKNMESRIVTRSSGQTAGEEKKNPPLSSFVTTDSIRRAKVDFLQSPTKQYESKVSDKLQKTWHGGVQERQIFNQSLQLQKSKGSCQLIGRYSTGMVRSPPNLKMDEAETNSKACKVDSNIMANLKHEIGAPTDSLLRKLPDYPGFQNKHERINSMKRENMSFFSLDVKEENKKELGGKAA